MKGTFNYKTNKEFIVLGNLHFICKIFSERRVKNYKTIENQKIKIKFTSHFFINGIIL